MPKICIVMNTAYAVPDSVRALLALRTFELSSIPIVVADLGSPEAWRIAATYNQNITLLDRDREDSSRHAGRRICFNHILKNMPDVEIVILSEPEKEGIHEIRHLVTLPLWRNKRAAYVLGIRNSKAWASYPFHQQFLESMGNLHMSNLLYKLGMKKTLIPPFDSFFGISAVARRYLPLLNLLPSELQDETRQWLFNILLAGGEKIASPKVNFQISPEQKREEEKLRRLILTERHARIVNHPTELVSQMTYLAMLSGYPPRYSIEAIKYMSLEEIQAIPIEELRGIGDAARIGAQQLLLQIQ